MKKILLISFFAAFFSCKEETKNEEALEENVTETEKVIPDFTKDIETAHQKAKFISNEVVSYMVVVKFGGKERLSAKFTQTVSGSLIKMERSNGETVWYDGKEVYTDKNDANFDGNRFDIFTWSYFTTLPFKLNDEGTVWSEFEEKPFYDTKIPTGKLSFKANTGDAPDDWYVIYKDPIKNTLVGAAYIVTFGKDKATTEIEPHAIEYSNFTAFSGIPFATDWTFKNWNEKEGFGEVIGEAKVSEVSFPKKDDAMFKVPENVFLVSMKKEE